MKLLMIENFVKNALILVLLLIGYKHIHSEIHLLLNAADTSIAGDLLVVVSIVIVTACFGVFAFTYEKVKTSLTFDRLLAHATTGVLMLTVGISLEMTYVLSQVLLPSFSTLKLTLIILYIGVVLYDFWDLRRAFF